MDILDRSIPELKKINQGILNNLWYQRSNPSQTIKQDISAGIHKVYVMSDSHVDDPARQPFAEDYALSNDGRLELKTLSNNS
jgi:hypothetical protein